MLSDYGWQIKTWKFEDIEKRNKWITKHEQNYQIREIFVNNELAVEHKRKLVM